MWHNKKYEAGCLTKILGCVRLIVMKFLRYLSISVFFLLVAGGASLPVLAQNTDQRANPKTTQRPNTGQTRTQPVGGRSGQEREVVLGYDPVTAVGTRIIRYEEFIAKVQDRITLLSAAGANVSEAQSLLSQAQAKLAQIKILFSEFGEPVQEKRESGYSINVPNPRSQISRFRMDFQDLHELLKSAVKSLKAAYLALPPDKRLEANRDPKGDRTQPEGGRTNTPPNERTGGSRTR